MRRVPCLSGVVVNLLTGEIQTGLAVNIINRKIGRCQVLELTAAPRAAAVTIEQSASALLRGARVKRALSYGAPCFIELVTPGEQDLIPPVVEWLRVAREAAKQS